MGMDIFEFIMEASIFILSCFFVLVLVIITLAVIGVTLQMLMPADESPQGLWKTKMANECYFLNGKSRYIEENKTFECWYMGAEPKKIIEEKWKE